MEASGVQDAAPQLIPPEYAQSYPLVPHFLLEKEGFGFSGEKAHTGQGPLQDVRW